MPALSYSFFDGFLLVGNDGGLMFLGLSISHADGIIRRSGYDSIVSIEHYCRSFCNAWHHVCQASVECMSS